MLDRWSLKLLARPLKYIANKLHQLDVTANQVTVIGFAIGLTVIPLLAMKLYLLALLVILFNRLCDGVDGALARERGATDAGAYLDIVLDFIFYAAVVFGFALADPDQNALAAALLLFSFMGTGSSFLAFAIMAERRTIQSMQYPNKGFYYLGGVAEGTETIMLLLACCLFPAYFVWIAIVFSVICWLTTVARVIGGYFSLKTSRQKTSSR
ncbi:MAG: phosphatidylglycerophosphate synthase [Osedax symbiont Rs1]|nr:MAG: phosphatidylglycerophosphate synthase [Osedax symbiont Rs1]